MATFPTAVCASSELDLFTHPPLQTGIVSSRWVEYTPTVNFSNGQLPICIEIPGTKGEYIDLSNIYHYMRLSIINATTNQKITDADEIGPINYLHNTIFKNVEVKLNKTLVSMNSDYAYRSEIESHLNYNRDAKDSHLLSSLWYEDDYSNMDNLTFEPTTTTPAVDAKPAETVTNVRNMGLIQRKTLFHNSTVEVYGRPHLDICNMNKFLIDGVDAELKFYKNKDEFCLLGKPGYRLNIEEFAVMVRKVKVSQEVLLGHAMALEKASAFYPISRVDVQGRTINQGVISDKFENVIKGILPRRIIIGMVESEAYNGSLRKNPFSFKHFNLQELSVSVDGENTPYPPFSLNFSDKNNSRFLRAYYSLVNLESGAHNSIKPIDYLNGYNLIGFNLSPDGCVNTDHFNPDKTGNLRISFKFATALEQAISVILYMEYENYFEISKLRNIEYKFVS